jgi:pimeloyl-ACP methyl ester carboxylesterase
MEVRQVELGGRATRYRVVGSGTDLVVVHGLSGSWRWWLPLFERLQSRHRLHVVELPHLGRVRAGEITPWLESLLDAAGLDRVHLMGHSLGGLLATELALRQPDRVGRLVLVAPAGIPCGRGVLRRSVPLLAELFDVRAQLPTIAADALRTGPVSLMHGVAYIWERDLRAELPSVRTPTLLVWGERDRLVPSRIADEWRRLLPQSQLVRLPCGHVPMWEAPVELATCVLDFLGDELSHDVGDELGARVGDRVGLAGNDHEAAAG